MAFKFKDNKAFADILKQKQADIQKRASADIFDSDNFKKLHTSLITFLHKNSFRDYKSIIITKEDIAQLPDDFYNELEMLLNSDMVVHNRFILINNRIEIVGTEQNFKNISETHEVNKFYRELSKEYVIFLLQPEKKISLFVDGEDFIEGLFLTQEDLNSFLAKKTIDQLPSLFDDYRNHLKDRSIYNKFFISRSHLKSLHADLKSQLREKEFEDEYKHLLQNKPEDRFREDLRHFLSKNLRVKLLSKEYILENFKRLDIFIMDDSGYNLYLIEVKWVGESVHQDGKKNGTKYDSCDINPNGVIQSVKYIRQLDDIEKKNIKLAYLVVFDARKNQTLIDTVASFDKNILEDEDKPYYSKFRKVEDFKVVNAHPS